MDSPNTSARVRRMNSAPSKFHSHISFLPKRLQQDNNPYVGSFRHAPPTTLRSIAASMQLNRKNRHLSFVSLPRQATMRNSPYIGWFRHAPPSSAKLFDVGTLDLRWIERYRAIAMILARLALNQKNRSGLAQFINACLCGVSKGNHCVDSSILPAGSSKTTKLDSARPSISQETTSLLAKIGSWFQFPMTYDLDFYGLNDHDYHKLRIQSQVQVHSRTGDSDSEEGESDDSECDDQGDDESSLALSDFDAPMTFANSTAIARPIDITLPEIAEVYYSHKGDGRIERTALEEERLDYVITQSDIARMTRNAAKHLDVESILNLPTITYRTQKAFLNSTHRNQLQESRDPSESWSFIMMPSAASMVDEQVKPSSQGAVQETVCVICLEKFKDGDRLRVLPCDHSFHVGCIDRWLSGSDSHVECFTSGCPTCKKRPEVQSPNLNTCEELSDNDGSVPSWAFTRLGSQMAQSLDDF